MFNAAGNMDLKAMEEILNNKGVDVNYTCSSLNYRTVLHELVIGMYNIDISFHLCPTVKGSSWVMWAAQEGMVIN